MRDEHLGVTPRRSQRKFGDYVLELGPESASPGARVVFEAKAKKRYTVKNALTEDAATDIYLKPAFGLARTRAHRECLADSKADADTRRWMG